MLNNNWTSDTRAPVKYYPLQKMIDTDMQQYYKEHFDLVLWQIY